MDVPIDLLLDQIQKRLDNADENMNSLRTARHDLANRVQSMEGRLSLLYDKIGVISENSQKLEAVVNHNTQVMEHLQKSFDHFSTSLDAVIKMGKLATWGLAFYIALTTAGII